MTYRSGLVAFLFACAPASALDLPRVASINLCTDQLLLSLADADQILTVSWLSADPEESMLAAEARAFPLNYGSAEEILRYSPDVVVGGTYTSPFTRRLLKELGFAVVEIEPANSVGDIARNLRRVAAAIGQTARGDELARRMEERARTIRARQPPKPVAAVVLRPGGFTVGAGSLADDLMRLAGLENVAAEHGLDRWGSLSVESLIVSRPALLIYTGYRRDEASLANGVFDHPALSEVSRSMRTVEAPGVYWSCGLPESLASAELMQRAAASP